jgi:hypothetical protein
VQILCGLVLLCSNPTAELWAVYLINEQHTSLLQLLELLLQLGGAT